MKMIQLKNAVFLGLLLFTTTATQASIMNMKTTTTELAALTMHVKDAYGNTIAKCSPSLAACVVHVTYPCPPGPGSVTVSNNSVAPAYNITAFATSQTTNAGLVDISNGCPATLDPGAACNISFATTSNTGFTASNISVGGTNTNIILIDVMDYLCI